MKHWHGGELLQVDNDKIDRTFIYIDWKLPLVSPLRQSVEGELEGDRDRGTVNSNIQVEFSIICSFDLVLLQQ